MKQHVVTNQVQREEWSEKILQQARGARVLWDFDGVIADTEPIHEKTYRALGTTRNFPLPPDYFSEMVGHNEEWIWGRLLAIGFPATTDEVPELMSERAAVFRTMSEESLRPSWIAASLMPRISEIGSNQTVVSNGDFELINSLLDEWGLAAYVDVARRKLGESKDEIFTELCSPPVVVLEDSARFIGLARNIGAFTIGVRHSYNAAAKLDANLEIAL